MFKDFITRGKASFVIGGQFGSEGKGAAAAFLARRLLDAGTFPDIVTTNAGAQAGHTSINNGIKRVAFHLPTATLIAEDYNTRTMTFINGGAVIDPEICMSEIEALRHPERVCIHPNAAVITPDCKEAEGRADSAQTKIASTRKGVGEALARKVLRSGRIAKDEPLLKPYLADWYDLQRSLDTGGVSALAEVPQGIGLSINEPFYPHCTSRNCTISQAMADAGIHPSAYGASLLVLRTYPIRVGHINADHEHVMAPDNAFIEKDATYLGKSGGFYPDQREISWRDLGVEPEITTVTKRVRRVFTFSRAQAYRALQLTRPSHVMITFCDYPGYDGNQRYVRDIRDYVLDTSKYLGFKPTMLYGYGPSTGDVYSEIH